MVLPEIHPIVKQMKPSDEQQPAVMARGCDVVVTAGAGTGKTRTLVARYLALLAEGLPLRSIVAITFTRKAAREMRNRVRNEMRRYLEWSERLDERERRRWQRLYSELDAARIGTIHSLCTEMLRAHPAEACVDPRFEVLDEGQTNILRQQAVGEALAWAADDERAVTLFALLGEFRLKIALASLLGKRLEVQQGFALLPEPLWPAWEALLVPPIQAFVDGDDVRAAFGELFALRANGTLDRAEAARDSLAAPLRRLLALWDEVVAARQADDWPAVSARLAALRNEMKQKGRAANWKPANPKAVIKELQVLYDARLSDWVGRGINLELDRQLAEAMPVLRRLFEKTVAFYGRLKEERQALDFDDLEHGALVVLRENAAVRARWLAEVEAILVDEFQDTNCRQRDLVKLLNGNGGRLFIVGDAKQSIYRFRGADVTVFRQERERIGQGRGKPFQLKKSYRAHQDLIQGLNDLLRPVLGETADPDRPWVEPFAPLQHHREEPGAGFEPPYIELHLTVGSKAKGALGRAADALAGRIVALVKDGVQIVEDGESRPLNYGDVAILCRASRSFPAYEDALDRAGLPFLTVAGGGFYKRPEIRDLLNALRALSDPTDSLALAGLLRSPAFALSDAALFYLCQGQEQDTESVSLWSALQERGAALGGEDGRRAERASRTIADLHSQVGRVSVAGLLKAFLDATGYRAALIPAGQSRGARNAAKLLADAHASDIIGVGEFMEYVSGLRDSGTREGEARATVEGAVQIMSVHAAKGLEFPVVVIGDVTYHRGARASLLIDSDLGVLLPFKDEGGRMPGLYRVGQMRAVDQENVESDRLFYVAATRAREKLMFSGCIGLTQSGKASGLRGWLGKVAGPEGLGLGEVEISYDEEGAHAVGGDLREGQTPVACTIYEPGYDWDRRPDIAERESKPERVPLPPPLLEPVLPGEELVDRRISERDRIPPQRVWRVVPAVKRPRAPAWVVGSLVHEALAAWRFPDDAPSTGSGQGFERWAKARARGHGLTDPRQLADAGRQSQLLLRRFQLHPLYAKMEGADRRLAEVPYSRVVDGRVESGIMDALYLRGNIWTIVEFKTDRVENEAKFRELLEREDYLAQAQRYVAAAEQLLGQRPRSFLCMLNYAGAVRLHPVGVKLK